MSRLSHETIGFSVINQNTQSVLSVWVNHHVCYFLFPCTPRYSFSLRQFKQIYVYILWLLLFLLLKHHFAALKIFLFFFSSNLCRDNKALQYHYEFQPSSSWVSNTMKCSKMQSFMGKLSDIWRSIQL